MKKHLLLLLIALFLTGNLYAEFDFSAVCETGQTLYYDITSAENRTVKIVCPEYGMGGWYGYQEPTGNIELPSHVEFEGNTYTVSEIGVCAFAECMELTGSLSIPNTVVSVGYQAFFLCLGFEGTLTLSDNLSDIEGLSFDACRFTGSLKIPESVLAIGESAFRSNHFTGHLVIPDNVKYVGQYAFNYCTFDSLTISYNSITHITEATFSNCLNLAVINLPKNITTIGSSAFENTAYYLDPENWTDSVLYIDNYLINVKTGISGECRIKEGTTLIAGSAFNNCSDLTAIDIPNSIINIFDYAFSGCSSLNAIKIRATTPPTIYYFSFSGISKNIPIYIPCDTGESYRTSEFWSSFNNFRETLFYTLLIESNDEEMGSVEILQSPSCENQAIVQAIPNNDYEFVNWTRNDVIISTDAVYSFTVEEDMTITANFRRYDALEECNSENGSAYPNPGSNSLNIRTTLQNAIVEVFDLQGKRLCSQEIGDIVTSIDTDSWESGVYLWNVVKDGKICESGKWVKE